MKPFKRFSLEIDEKNVADGAIYGVACTYALLEKVISQYLQNYNLFPAKFNALIIIKHIGGGKGISQIDIGRRLIVTPSNMTRLLDKLDGEGFIERLSLKGDRRVKLIRISKKGSDLLDQVWPGYYQKIQELANILDKKELRQLAFLSRKWCVEIDKVI